MDITEHCVSKLFLCVGGKYSLASIQTHILSVQYGQPADSRRVLTRETSGGSTTPNFSSYPLWTLE